MTLPRSVGDVLGEHITYELESIDRLYLNLYVPGLRRPEGGGALLDPPRAGGRVL